MDRLNYGELIREFFRELFGSRMAKRLETDIERIRGDFELRIQEYKLTNSELKSEKAVLLAKIAQYEAALLPLSSRGAALVKPTKQPSFAEPFEENSKTSWDEVQDAWTRMQDQEESAEKQKSTAANAV